MFMNNEQREIQRKLRILRYGEETGHVAKTCLYFGIGRTSFYRWRQSYKKYGEDGLINRRQSQNGMRIERRLRSRRKSSTSGVNTISGP